MSADHCGVRAHRPIFVLGIVTPRPQPVHDPLPHPLHRPAAMPAAGRLPVAVTPRKITPGTARSGPEEHAADHHPVIRPPARPAADCPATAAPAAATPIRQIMTLQAIIIRTDDLYRPIPKIHGIRPNRDSPSRARLPRSLGRSPVPAEGRRSRRARRLVFRELVVPRDGWQPHHSGSRARPCVLGSTRIAWFGWLSTFFTEWGSSGAIQLTRVPAGPVSAARSRSVCHPGNSGFAPGR
jgi:hypothetical protein